MHKLVHRYRSSSRRFVTVVFAALAAVVGAVTAFGAAPKTVATFKIPDFPGGVVSAYGSIWISTHRGSLLYRINPRTNRIVKQLYVLDPTCWSEADGGKVWVFGCGNGTGRAIDPRTNKVGPRVSGDAVYHGGGSVWLRMR